MHDETQQLKHERDETLASLTDKVTRLDDYVSDTVQSVTTKVQTARNTVDIKRHIRRRPWTFLAGAVALGFLGGYQAPRGAPRPPGPAPHNGAPPAMAREPEPSSRVPRSGGGEEGGEDAGQQPDPAPGWAGNLVHSMDAEYMVKTFAVPVLASLVRELISYEASKIASPSTNARRSGNEES